jgi:tetratricopeptide (TPR) repeat protein
VLFGQLHSFLERHGDEALRGLWNASAPDLLTAKIDALVEALNENSYLLIFDEFSSWLDEQLQVKNPELRRVLHAFISSAHRSKILLISERKPFFDPQASPIPAGVAQNEELFGLEESDGIRLLKEYLPYEDENLLRRTVQICGANPRMLNWFGYLVAHGREDIKTLLASEGAELSGKLLAKSVEGLTRESQDALERLAVFRRPLKKQDLDQLHVSFHKAVAPLLDRFLATWCPKDNSVTLAQPAKALVRARLGHERRRSLHLEAVGFYAAEQSATEPTAFRDVLPILEKAYHLAEAGQGQEATDVFLGVSKSLTEWGYLDLVQEYVGGALEASKADPLRRARCLWTLADVHDLRSQYPEALDRFQESLQEFESVQDYEGVASCRWRLGRVRNALGEFASALEDFQTCIEICDQRKVTGAKAAALLDQGWTLAQQGSRDQALALMERSLELATSSDDYQTQISAGRQIGWILWDYRGENQKARECYERALEIGVKRGFLKELGAVHGDLGYLLTQWGDTEAAEESCRAAIKIREALGDQHGLASSYLNLGLVFHTRNATVEETRCYEESLAIYRRLKVPGGQAEVLLRQGIAWRKRAQYTESENALKQALGIVKSHDLKLILADVQHELGRTLRLAGRDEEAGTWLVSAAEEADKIGSPRAAEYAQFAKPIVN